MYILDSHADTPCIQRCVHVCAQLVQYFRLVVCLFRLTLSYLGRFLLPLVLQKRLLVQRGLESSQQDDSRSFLSELSLVFPLMPAFHCGCATVTVPMEWKFIICKHRVQGFYIVAYFQTVSIWRAHIRQNPT